MGLIKDIVILVVALVIVELIFNPSYFNVIKTTLSSIGTSVINSAKYTVSPTPQNQALVNCTSQVNSAIKILSDKWLPNSQISIVNTTIFAVANTSPIINVTISQPNVWFTYNGSFNTVKNSLTTKINVWINEWAAETGEQGGINCYQNGTRAGSYICRDLKLIALSNETVAIGEVVRIAGDNYGSSYSITLPVLCNASGAIMPHSKNLLISGSSNGDFLDA